MAVQHYGAMLKRVIVICAVLGSICAVLGSIISTSRYGPFVGLGSATKSRAKHDLELHKQLIALDQSFLTNVVTRPNSMTNGVFELEVRMAGKPAQVTTVELTFSDREFFRASKVPDWFMYNVARTGNVVSWERHHEDDDQGPVATFIGVIDGNGMWGRVYVAPWEGWHEGDPPAYGVWRLHPKSDSPAPAVGSAP